MSAVLDVVSGFEAIVDKLIPDPKAAAELKLELFKAQQAIPLAEAQSSDKWTSRARPMFMYLFYFLLFNLIIIFPIVGIFFPANMTQFYLNVATGFKAIPHELWTTFTYGYLGYSALRTHEKQPFFGGK